MTIRADKWVVAAIAAVQNTKLVNIDNPADAIRICDFFGFHVASLWISDHPDAYRVGLRDGFDSITTLSNDEMDHAAAHIAVVLSASSAHAGEARCNPVTVRPTRAPLSYGLNTSPAN